jgi:hypothetical protein
VLDDLSLLSDYKVGTPGHNLLAAFLVYKPESVAECVEVTQTYWKNHLEGSITQKTVTALIDKAVADEVFIKRARLKLSGHLEQLLIRNFHSSQVVITLNKISDKAVTKEVVPEDVEPQVAPAKKISKKSVPKKSKKLKEDEGPIESAPETPNNTGLLV